jgi:hypothetical protein
MIESIGSRVERDTRYEHIQCTASRCDCPVMARRRMSRDVGGGLATGLFATFLFTSCHPSHSFRVVFLLSRSNESQARV